MCGAGARPGDGQWDFVDRAAYTQFLQHLVTQRNLTRRGRWAEEQAVLRPITRCAGPRRRR